MKRIILLGDQHTGKTTFLSVFLRKQEHQIAKQYRPTLGIEAAARTVQFEDKSFLNVQIWDTSGEEQLRHQAARYFSSCKVFIVLIDRSNIKTLKTLEDWLRDIKSQNSLQHSSIIVIANKTGQREEFSKSKFENEYQKWLHQLQYIELDVLQERDQIEEKFIKRFLRQLCQEDIVVEETKVQSAVCSGGSNTCEVM